MSKNFIVALFAGLLIVSCNPLRHYKKVEKDQPRNEAKRKILAPICALEFPVVPKTDTVTTTEYKPDTTNENRLKLIIRQLAKHLENLPECPQIDVDSLHDAIAASIKPDTIFKKKIITNAMLDSAAMVVAQNKYDDLLNLHDDSLKVLNKLRENHEELKANTDSSKWLLSKLWRLNWWWILLLLGATTAIIILLKKAKLI